MNVLVLLIATVASCIAGVAQADTVTYTGSFSGPTDVTNQVIQVQQFNSSLGSLESVSFTLGATMNTSAFATNDGDFYAGWDKLQYSLSLTGDAGYNNIAISANDPAARLVGTGTAGSTFSKYEQNIISSSPNETYVGPGSYVWNFAGPTLSATNSFAQGANAAFIGTGDLNFFLTTANLDSLAFGGTQTNGIPPNNQGLSTSIASNVSVTYTYAEPVPEPETYAMLLAGLGLLGFMVQRRIQKAA
jgi:hypothetical protein